MKKEITKGLKTLAMKATLANFVRKSLNNYIKEPTKWNPYKKEVLTNEKKLELFNQIYDQYVEMNNSLLLYKWKKKRKAVIQKLRDERNLEKAK